MHVVSEAHGVEYHAAAHRRVRSVRVQGGEAGGPSTTRVSFSRYEAGAEVGPAPTLAETVYVVLEGEFVLTSLDDDATLTLGVHDTVHLRRGEVRRLHNATDRSALLLVVLTGEDDAP